MTKASTLCFVSPFTYRGYCYDYDIELYYLQSRYYSAEIGRFINADSTDYLGATGTVLSFNLFAYCENNPTNEIDYTGTAPFRFIGFGFQLELTLGRVTFGVEIVWYTDAKIRNGRAAKTPYLYLYGGTGLSGNLRSILSKIYKNPALLFNPKKLTKNSASISIFAIFGFKNFTKPKHYTGAFTTASITVKNIKSYTSWCTNCFVVGLGVSTALYDINTSASYYFLDYEIMSGLSNLYNKILTKAKQIKA